MADVVSLQDVKVHLRSPMTNTSDDAALTGFIWAADDVIVTECGDVVACQYDEFHSGGDVSIWLRNTPIIQVDNVEEGWGWYNWELNYQQVNTVPATNLFAYSIDGPKVGKITRRSAGNVSIPFMPGLDNIHVIYTAGRVSVPGSIRLAALELIAHWWQSSQLRAQMGSAMNSQYDTTDPDFTRSQAVTSINLGVPTRILELLKRYRHLPYIG